MEPTWAKVDSVPTSIPVGKVLVSVSVPQEKSPADHSSLEVRAVLHELKPEPKSCEEEAKDVFSNAKDVEVPVERMTKALLEPTSKLPETLALEEKVPFPLTLRLPDILAKPPTSMLLVN